MLEVTPQKILLIEDDKFLSELLAQRFQKEGFNLELAIDGESGLEKVRGNSFNLIILDLILPGMDGYEVLKQLKSDTLLAKIPVVILSNLGQKDEITRGLEMGAIDFLVKAHFDLDEIIERIRKILERSKK